MPETFEEIAKKAKDYIFTNLSATESVYQMEGGICAAHAMAYIKSQRKGRGKTGVHYFDDVSSKTGKPRSHESLKKRFQIIQDLYTKGVKANEQIDFIKKRLADNYKMSVTLDMGITNATVQSIYQYTYHKGLGHYLLFMCIKQGSVQKDNHFMAISIGAEKCTFYDPNEGELATKNDKFWPLLWKIMTKSELKSYFPDNMTAISGYY